MKTLIVLALLLTSSFVLSATVECLTSNHKFTIQQSGSDLYITLNNETVPADGLVQAGEVDLIAKFKSIGEMTLFAKIGKAHPENYVFIKGTRFSVNCR